MSDYSGSSRSNTPAPGGEGCQEESLLVRGGGRDYEDGIAADDDDPDETRVTCDVLCSLSGVVGGTMISSSSSYPACTSSSPAESIVHDHEMSDLSNPCKKLCPKQHQLPMFLSKTFHMMDRCDPEIATWSTSGDNFVVKDVEQFSTKVLPLYFKHSNFSSFARQLNFYGFRKLRTDPILTSDVDPSTASYVRFYHDKFQKNKPELLHHIKRATKSDQQSKDDVDSLKGEVTRLRDCITHMSMDMDRKLMEMSFEYNRRISALSAEYDKLAGLVSQVLNEGGNTSSNSQNNGGGGGDDQAVLTTSSSLISTTATGSSCRGTDLMQSLSRVAGELSSSFPSSSSSSTEDMRPTTTNLLSSLGNPSGGSRSGGSSSVKKRQAPVIEEGTSSSSSSSGKRRGCKDEIRTTPL